MKPYARKQYWNQPTMSWWERAYLPEIVRGLAITGGVAYAVASSPEPAQAARAFSRWRSMASVKAA